MIQQFNHPLIMGKDCFIHFDFLPYMGLFCKGLADTGCAFYVTSSGRYTTIVPGAIVAPAKMSNHLVFHAIDGNIYDRKRHLWNSVALEKPTGEVLEFINYARTIGRWGGDFKPDIKGKTDPVHFDDGLNIKNPARWHELYDEIQTSRPA